MMNKNVRIAKELVKLAKSLIALDEDGDGSGFQVLHDMDTYKITDERNLANKPGKYENFTGKIEWKGEWDGTFGTVENATFELKNSGNGYLIIWEDGTWKDGQMFKCDWKKGTWEKGTFIYGSWEGGTWKNGNFRGGTWDGDYWDNGTFEYGLWNGGVWENGKWMDGTWKQGIWYDGIWERGNWNYGWDKNKNIHPKGDSPNKWKK